MANSYRVEIVLYHRGPDGVLASAGTITETLTEESPDVAKDLFKDSIRKHTNEKTQSRNLCYRARLYNTSGLVAQEDTRDPASAASVANPSGGA